MGHVRTNLLLMSGVMTLSAVFAVGCATTVKVTSIEPGAVNLGAAKSLALLQGEGRRSARETVFQDLMNLARTQGYYQITDRTEEGIKVTVAGRKVTVDGDKKGPQPGEMYLRIDVLNWDARRDTKEKEVTDAAGKTKTITKVLTTGKASLAVTLFDKDGNAILAEKEYEGRFETEDKDMMEEAVIKSAGTDAIMRLLKDITPRRVVRNVRLDEDDKAQKPMLEAAEKGNIAEAKADLEKYVAANPNNAAAAYNLGVFIEASGDYDAALAKYDQALKLGTKDYYVKARADCAKRKADAESLTK